MLLKNGLKMVCSIHKPDFFPTFPFFQKMNNSDVFVILHTGKFNKGGTHNRFRLKGKTKNLNALTVSNYKTEPINKKSYLNPIIDFEDIKKNLPDYRYLLRHFDTLIQYKNKKLWDLNSQIIQQLCFLLSIDHKKIKYTYPVSKDYTHQLIIICKYYNCKTYLTQQEEKRFLDIKLFKHYGIKLKFQKENTLIKKPILEYIKDAKIA